MAAQGSNRPTVAIVEDRLPDTTGIELASELRSLDADLSVVILTGHATMQSAIAAIGLVDAYLTKPVRADELLRRVRSGIERAQRRSSDRDLIKRIQAMHSFVGTLSHELRTPLNGVLGTVHLLLDSELDVSQRHFLDLLHESGENLLAIIEPLLDLSKIEAGKLELE
jgi:signal transduction histidine kinase